jgi:hypothetical protein
MDLTPLIAFLAPARGFLLKTGEEAAGEPLARSVREHARRIWARLGPVIGARPAAQEAARDLAGSPDDEGARAALAWQLRKAVEADPSLGEDLQRLWAAAQPVVAGERGVAVGGDVVDSVVVTGDGNRIGGRR